VQVCFFFFLYLHLTSYEIIAPHDQGISESIKANLEPKAWSTTDLPSELCADVGNAMREAYFESLQKASLTRQESYIYVIIDSLTLFPTES
jgi:hypothetical protein